MQHSELAKVYMSCIKNKLELTPKFRAEMDDLLLNKLLPKTEAQSLPYILPLLTDT
jgi:hypothetical protein